MTVELVFMDREAEVILGAIQPTVAAALTRRDSDPLRSAFIKLYAAVIEQAKPYVVAPDVHETYSADTQRGTLKESTKCQGNNWHD